MNNEVKTNGYFFIRHNNLQMKDFDKVKKQIKGKLIEVGVNYFTTKQYARLRDVLVPSFIKGIEDGTVDLDMKKILKIRTAKATFKLYEDFETIHRERTNRNKNNNSNQAE